MITGGVMQLFTSWIAGLLDAVPDTAVPSWMADGAGYLPGVFAFANSMGVWFPWGVLGVVLASVFTVWGASFLFKLVRIGISHFTGGGGSAA